MCDVLVVLVREHCVCFCSWPQAWAGSDFLVEPQQSQSAGMEWVVLGDVTWALVSEPWLREAVPWEQEDVLV